MVTALISKQFSMVFYSRVSTFSSQDSCARNRHIYIEDPNHTLPAVTTLFLERIDELTILVSRSSTMRRS